MGNIQQNPKGSNFNVPACRKTLCLKMYLDVALQQTGNVPDVLRVYKVLAPQADRMIFPFYYTGPTDRFWLQPHHIVSVFEYVLVHAALNRYPVHDMEMFVFRSVAPLRTFMNWCAYFVGVWKDWKDWSTTVSFADFVLARADIPYDALLDIVNSWDVDADDVDFQLFEFAYGMTVLFYTPIMTTRNIDGMGGVTSGGLGFEENVIDDPILRRIMYTVFADSIEFLMQQPSDTLYSNPFRIGSNHFIEPLE